MDERLVGKPTVALAQFFFNPGGAKMGPPKKNNFARDPCLPSGNGFKGT